MGNHDSYSDVLELARHAAPLKGVVTFHGGLETKNPAPPGQVKAKLLILTGADDPTVPVAQVNAFAEEMTKAGADWQIVSYGGPKHAFTYPDAATRRIEWIEYNKMAEEPFPPARPHRCEDRTGLLAATV